MLSKSILPPSDVQLSLTFRVEPLTTLVPKPVNLIDEYPKVGDETLFELIEKTDDLFSNIDEIVYRSLLIKKEVVEKDEKENGLRKVLNFGHTIGHGLESYFDTLYLHGECVGLGMLYMVSKDLKDRLTKLLVKYGLPVKVKYEKTLCNRLYHWCL